MRKLAPKKQLLLIILILLLLLIFIGRIVLISMIPSSQTVVSYDKGLFDQFLNKQKTTVIHVIDGDTIIVSGGEKVRYIGIDTPETVDPKKPVGCFGKEASEINTKLTLGKTIYMARDVSEKDKYNRLLRYIWVSNDKDASNSALFINGYLVSAGYAYADSVFPDISLHDYFTNLQNEAQKNNKGLWALCLKRNKIK